jgi:hypothetical protein
MGLGKTLTTIATIVSTLENAQATLDTRPLFINGPRGKNISKATLIVVPQESMFKGSAWQLAALHLADSTSTHGPMAR